MARNRGFTLIELMIVVAMIAIIAAIALPNLIAVRITSDESAAVSTLKTLFTAESVAKTTGVIDQDVDGIGEYAWFAEMGSSTNLRDNVGPNNGPLLQPSLLAQSLGQVNANGVVAKSGYLFRIALPGPGGVPVVENAGGGSPAGEDPDLCESNWIVYAWPASYATSGKRVFVSNQVGDLVQSDNLGGGGIYEGLVSMPAPDAALENGAAGTIIGEISVMGAPAPAVDGKTWRPVN